MELLRSRNQQSAMPALLNMLYSNGTLKDGILRLTDPVMLVYEKPRERLIFWPGFQRNPAKELVMALAGLRQIEDVIPSAAQDVVAGKEHFIFSTPQLAIQANVEKDKLYMRTIVAEPNPFQGALGSLSLQLTILQELMANAANIDLGTFSIQHMNIAVKAEVVEMLLKESLDRIPEDPYQNGLKVRKIDGKINMAMLLDEGAAAQGYRSKWVRTVALPLFVSAQAEDYETAKKLAGKIKADDWKRNQLEYLDALRAAKETEKKESE